MMDARLKIGYARCSKDDQDVAAQRLQLGRLGVADQHIHIDHGWPRRGKPRPGLANALVAVRAGEILVVTKLDRLGAGVVDLRTLADGLVERGVSLQLGEMIYDPTTAIGKLFFNCLAMFTEFELDIIHERTRDGMEIARRKGKLRGKQPKLSTSQQKHVVDLYRAETHSIADLGELMQVSRATIYRVLARHGVGVGAA